MKYLQHVRGKWIVRVTVPQELREIIGKRELVENDLPADKKARERKAVAVINGFYATIEDAREVLLSRRPTLSTAAKEHYRAELEADDRGRVVRSTATADVERYSRTIYANKLRLLVAGAMEQAEAEALIGYAADDLKAKGRAPDLPRSLLLRSLAQVQLEALSRFEERDEGAIMLSEPKLPLLTEPARLLAPSHVPPSPSGDQGGADACTTVYAAGGYRLASATADVAASGGGMARRAPNQ